MQGIILTIAILGFTFFLAYVALGIDSEEHGVLTLLLLLLALSSSLLLPKIALDDLNYCDFVQVNESDIYIYGNNFTAEHWDNATGAMPNQPANNTEVFHINKTFSYDYVCSSNSNTTTLTFQKLVYAIPAIVLMYILIYVFWKMFIKPRRRRKNDT